MASLFLEEKMDVICDLNARVWWTAPIQITDVVLSATQVIIFRIGIMQQVPPVDEVKDTSPHRMILSLYMMRSEERDKSATLTRN